MRSKGKAKSAQRIHIDEDADQDDNTQQNQVILNPRSSFSASPLLWTQKSAYKLEKKHQIQDSQLSRLLSA
jgi:hypothetical protein